MTNVKFVTDYFISVPRTCFSDAAGAGKNVILLIIYVAAFMHTPPPLIWVALCSAVQK